MSSGKLTDGDFGDLIRTIMTGTPDNQCAAFIGGDWRKRDGLCGQVLHFTNLWHACSIQDQENYSDFRSGGGLHAEASAAIPDGEVAQRLNVCRCIAIGSEKARARRMKIN